MLRARLTVTSEQGRELGAQATHDFDAAGGIIGRAGTCDWRLPDTSHTLSSRHAEIRFNGHGFMVVDLSTNGVYVNTTDAPLGRGNAAVLVNGDQLYLGTYVIAVELLRAAEAPAAARPPADPLPPPAPAPSAFPPARRDFAPQPLPGARPATRDPLAALDGASMLQDSDNPFGDLGIGHPDGIRHLEGHGAEAGPRAPWPSGLPAGLPPQGARRPMPDPAPVTEALPEPVRPLVPPRAPEAATPAPFPPARTPPLPAPPVAPEPPEAAVIPPDFLDELSILIPRLVEAGAAAPPAEVPPSLDDPEEMVTLLRMRGKGKTPTPPAPPRPAAQPFPAGPAPFDLAPAAAGPANVVTGAPLAVPVPTTPAEPQPSAPFAAPPLQATPLAAAPLQAAALVAPLQVRPLQVSPMEVGSAFPPLSPPGAPEPGRAAEAGFWALLGVDAARLSGAERGRLLGEVAGLLRAVLQGLFDLRDMQAHLKRELQLGGPVGADNPFVTAATPEEALARTLGQRGRASPGEGRGFGPGATAAAAQAMLDEMCRHEMAAGNALPATIASLLDRVSPAAIAFDIEEEGPSGGIFARKADKAKLWDRYLMMHERLVDALDVVGAEQMGRAFARAYNQDGGHPPPEET
ncbi:type VI secretion system-associated FHA domain protein [Xanthobacter sp. V2C-8]|uniref:type VI secretion system-associated FHA domain protein n=1 Tax=Xanthobacter albus TaxID=3119929 RepID=UPI00372A78D7